jgi:hypothetical protein
MILSIPQVPLIVSREDTRECQCDGPLQSMMSPSRKEDDMPAITRSPRQSGPARPLAEIDMKIRRLWAEEPICDMAERDQLLTDLRELTVDVERLEFREQFDADEGMCATVVRRCADRFDRLSQHWPVVHGSPPLSPAS